MKHFLYILVLGISLLPSPILADQTQNLTPTADDYQSVGDIRADIAQLMAEKKTTDQKIEANIILLKKEDDKWSKIEEEAVEKMAEIQKAGPEIEADRPAVKSKCSGSYDEGDPYNQAMADCMEVLKPFNKRVAANKDNVDWIEKHAMPIINAQKKLHEENAKLNMSRVQTIRKIGMLKRLVPVVARRECSSQCGGDAQNNDTAAQCLQHCMDGAMQAEALPHVEDAPSSGTANVIFPDWENSGKRTPEEAIEEYTKGKKAGPNTFKVKEPPPPPAR